MLFLLLFLFLELCRCLLIFKVCFIFILFFYWALGHMASSAGFFFCLLGCFFHGGYGVEVRAVELTPPFLYGVTSAPRLAFMRRLMYVPSFSFFLGLFLFFLFSLFAFGGRSGNQHEAWRFYVAARQLAYIYGMECQ
ncbi:hypothetical protein GGI42DRAFT_199763 [Trichoderma sp. SZMC 28013]